MLDAGQKAITDMRRDLRILGIVPADSFDIETGGHITFDNVKRVGMDAVSGELPNDLVQ